MDVPTITIGGQPLEDLSLVSVHFVRTPDGAYRAVLYRQGRRVIQPWTLSIDHAEPEDLYGSSG